VSSLGFGCGSVGGLMVRGEVAEQQRAVARALDAGITYFDTAPSYGDGRSEESLGRALANLGGGARALIGTKVRLAPTELAAPGAAVRRSLETSLRRLGRDRVDALHLHNPVTASLDLGPIVEAMRRAAEDGLVGRIGFTGLGETESLHEAVESGAFQTVQAYCNAINPSAIWPGASGGDQDFQGLARRAADRGVGVLVIRVLAAGALAGAIPRHPVAGPVGGPVGGSYDEDVERAGALSRLAGELGLESSLELGLRFILAAPGIATALVGLSSVDQLEAAIRWHGRGPLAADAVERVLELARPRE
jgi:aryl-alcohol dehydrogenase-like predicted oxidoreductase